MYRADLWQYSDYRCEVWCVSRSIASVVLKDCNELAVDLYPCGGFSSLSFVHEAAEAQNYSDVIDQSQREMIAAERTKVLGG